MHSVNTSLCVRLWRTSREEKRYGWPLHSANTHIQKKTGQNKLTRDRDSELSVLKTAESWEKKLEWDTHFLGQRVQKKVLSEEWTRGLRYKERARWVKS